MRPEPGEKNEVSVAGAPTNPSLKDSMWID
jgi:hypothetical protein